MHIGEVESSILSLATDFHVNGNMPYYVYILYSKVTDKYYIGYSENVELRLIKHNLGATPSTRSGRPWIISYKEECKDKTSAIIREREIKDKKSRKYIEWLLGSGG